MATPSVRDSTSGVNGATSLVPTLPTHAAGDVIAIMLFVNADVTGVTAGWTVVENGEGAFGSAIAFYVYKVAASSSESAPTITMDASRDLVWVAVAVTDADTTRCPVGPCDLDYEAEGSNVTSAQQANISAVYDNSLALTCFTSSVGATVTATLNSWTALEEITNAGGSVRHAWLASRSLSAAGGVTGPSLSFTSRNCEWYTLFFIGTGETASKPVVKKSSTATAAKNTGSTLCSLPVWPLAFRNRDNDYLVVVGAGGTGGLTASGSGVTGLTGNDFYSVGVLPRSELLCQYARLYNEVSGNYVNFGVTHNITSWLVLRGCSPYSPFARSSFSFEDVSTTAATVPVIETTHANQTHLILSGGSGNSGSAPPSGYTALMQYVGDVSASLHAAFKEYATAGSSTSGDVTYSVAQGSITAGLLLAPVNAALADLPAMVRTLSRVEAAATGNQTLYNLRAKNGDLLAFFGYAPSPSVAFTFSLSTPSGLTPVEIADEQDAGNAWNTRVKVYELEADTASDQIVVSYDSDPGSDMAVMVAIIERGNIDGIQAVEVIDNTSDTTLATSMTAFPGACSLAVVESQGATSTDTDADWSEQCFQEGYATNRSVSWIVDGSPPVGTYSTTFTANAAGKMMANHLLINKSAGGAGMFMGQDF